MYSYEPTIPTASFGIERVREAAIDGFLMFSRMILKLFGIEFKTASNDKALPSLLADGSGFSRAAVLVVDASPSMEEEDWPPSRLCAAKEAAIAFLSELRKSDIHAGMAVVTYAGDSEIVCPLTSVQDSSTIIDSINEIEAGWNGTNIAAGLEKAIEILKSANGPCQVALLTDGHDNACGNIEGIAKKLRQVATLECTGIGGSPADVDSILLKEIASTNPVDNSKRYRFIGQKDSLIQHFQSLAGRLATE